MSTTNNNATVTLAQSQSTTSGPSTGAMPYTAPTSVKTVNGVTTTTYDFRTIATDAKGAAYNQAIAQGFTSQQAENIASTAGLNAQIGAFTGVGNTPDTPATGIVGNGPNPSNSIGVGSANDDNSNGINTISGTSAAINASTQPAGLITPRSNLLDNYASYTYNIGWYLLTPAQAAIVYTNSKLDISQWSLLVQSGGASQEKSDSSQGTSTIPTPNRNNYFNLDYYLDDLEIETQLAGKAPGTNTSITFKVFEPNGLTLLPNLNNAVRTFYQDTDAAPNSAHYCLVIKFYGWDINGNLITDPAKNNGTPGAAPNNTNSIITRYYPFVMTFFHYKLSNKLVEYEITGTPAPFQYATSTATGSLPYNIEISGQTVKQILSGNGTINILPLDKNGQPIGSGREAQGSTSPNQTNGSAQKLPDLIGSENAGGANNLNPNTTSGSFLGLAPVQVGPAEFGGT